MSGTDGAWTWIYSADDLAPYPATRQGWYLGYVYAVEHGVYVKIGYTVSPKQRLKTILSAAANYGEVSTGRMVISPAHTNFKENEHIMHKVFKDQRVRAELFSITIDQFLGRATCLEFRDDSSELAEKSQVRVDRFMDFVTGKSSSL